MSNQNIPTDNAAQLPAQPHVQNVIFDPAQLIELLLQRFKMIVGITLLFLLIGGTYISFQRPQYTATSLIQLNTRERLMPGADTAVRPQDSAAVQSELDILKSPELTQRVIDKLALNTKEEFNPKALSQTKVGVLKRKLTGAFKQKNEKRANSPQAQEIENVQVVRAVLGRLDLKKDPLSYTVRISFTSAFPARAKNIANAYAQEYLKFQIDSHEQTSRRANEWLGKRVKELRADVILSEKAVQQFSEDNNLFQLDGRTLDDQQLSEMNSQLAQARSAFAQAEAKLAQAKTLLSSGAGIESVPEVLNSLLIQRLQEQEVTLVRERSELSGHFGSKHPTMEKINSELRDLRNKIASETRKIVKGLKNELEVARARVEALEGQFSAMRNRLGVNTKQAIQLSELQREAEANRTLYEAFLARLKETGEAINLEQTNAKIIAQAQLPLSPSKPRKSLIIALFLMAGGFCGMSLALLLEYVSRGFITARQIEDQLGLTVIGMSPEMPKNGKTAAAHVGTGETSSIYTEALRRILTGLQFANSDSAPRSVMIISSLPQEGKGWLATSLAQVMTGSGKKVLLLDCDLHRRNLVTTFGEGDADTHESKTLNAYLDANAEIKDVIIHDAQTGLDMIGSDAVSGNVQKLLESDRMKTLMDYAHDAYDMVFVDAPPVIGLSDAVFLSQIVDSAVFVIQWTRTPRRVVENAMRILSRARISIAGVVLSRVDPQHYKKQEFGGVYLYRKYGDYYHEFQDESGENGDKARKSKIVNLRD